MDDEEDDEEWEGRTKKMKESETYVEVLSRSRLSLQYFNLKDNPYFISTRFLR